jgi:hypothetical protein
MNYEETTIVDEQTVLNEEDTQVITAVLESSHINDVEVNKSENKELNVTCELEEGELETSKGVQK